MQNRSRSLNFPDFCEGQIQVEPATPRARVTSFPRSSLSLPVPATIGFGTADVRAQSPISCPQPECDGPRLMNTEPRRRGNPIRGHSRTSWPPEAVGAFQSVLGLALSECPLALYSGEASDILFFLQRRAGRPSVKHHPVCVRLMPVRPHSSEVRSLNTVSPSPYTVVRCEGQTHKAKVTHRPRPLHRATH